MIETERLILRRVDPERDFEPWAKAMADEHTRMPGICEEKVFIFGQDNPAK